MFAMVRINLNYINIFFCILEELKSMYNRTVATKHLLGCQGREGLIEQKCLI